MKKQKVLALQLLLFLFTLINSVNAAEESFVDQFLSSPLIVLVAIILIDIIAFIYHKVRR
ncbi:MAG: hypothetical protein OEY95_03710 [Candidatus Bathyarchaeota archaeon]|nr:hypothetical protein [Candidatus Bathyarchaeota archaeon]MDH5754298.1 hypothetical protein [Candidatus Bathyarchaeota archaeon]